MRKGTRGIRELVWDLRGSSFAPGLFFFAHLQDKTIYATA